MIPPSSGDSPVYGWLMLAGIALSLGLWIRMARRDERMIAVYIGGLVGAFLGAKLAYLFAELWFLIDQPEFWKSILTGKSIIGALLGGYGGVELAKKLTGYTKATGDWFAMIVPVTIILGRLGCMSHGCCIGRSFGQFTWPAVPVEIGFNLLFLVGMLILRSRHWLPGQHFHLYLIGYGLFRFGHEFVRGTPKLLWQLSGYQLVAILVVALGTWRYFARRNEILDIH